MVDHDRALNIAIASLKALSLSLENDTSTHESEWPDDPEVVGPRRQAAIAEIRKMLERVSNQIDVIDHYNMW